MILATSWKNLNGILLTERTHSQNVTFSLYINNILVKKKNYGSDDQQLPGLGVGESVTTDSKRESFRVTELILYPDSGGSKFMHVLKVIELYKCKLMLL